MKRFFLILLLLGLTSFPLVTHAATTPGSVIKLSCPKNADVNHICKAVYFYGNDGKRHAFPNEKVYFSWYTDFSSVQTVTSAFLASIPLGENATYRPGIKMVKFTTLDKTYAVGLGGTLHWVKTENAATSLYGADWNKKIDDLSDAFYPDYRFGSDIETLADFAPTTESAFAPTLDQNLESTFRSMDVVTDRGTFKADVITLQKDQFDLITTTGNAGYDCETDCVTKSLLDYANANGASIGIHGTYFCPPDYADCAGKTNSFLSPVFDSQTRMFTNAESLPVHEGPLLAALTDGRYFFFHRTKDLGNSVSAFEATQLGTLAGAISNYPSLIENGNVIVESESRLEEAQKTVKGTRGGIGYNDRLVFLVIAKSATVPDLADVMKKLGATSALNLDGGGSTALLYNGVYKDGPGRTLPNAILFKKKAP